MPWAGGERTVCSNAASVLFIGDSFCYGAGLGIGAASIPALYEKANRGEPVYAACKNGYGPAHNTATSCAG